MIFIIAIGVLVVGITMNYSVSFKDSTNIVFFCIFVSLLISLIGQLFWKNLSLAMLLATVLGLGSIYMTMGWFIEVIKDADIWAILAFVLFVGLSFAAITMPIKYVKMIVE